MTALAGRGKEPTPRLCEDLVGSRLVGSRRSRILDERQGACRDERDSGDDEEDVRRGKQAEQCAGAELGRRRPDCARAVEEANRLIAAGRAAANADDREHDRCEAGDEDGVQRPEADQRPHATDEA